MNEENCLSLARDLCLSFLTEDQQTTISEHDLMKLVKSTLSNFFTQFKNDTGDTVDGYSLLRTEIITRILAGGSNCQNRSKEIGKYLNAIEEVYQNSDAKDELNSMFLFLYKLSQNSLAEISQTKNTPSCFFGGSFNGSNWNIFHQDPGLIFPAFNYPFYDPPGTDVKLIQDFCPALEPLSNDFSKFFDGKFKLYRFDLNRPVETTFQDEGFVTPGSEFSNETDALALSASSESAMSISSSSDEFEFDSQVLKLSKKTWEQLGSEEYLPELPFASEYPDSVIRLWKILNASQNPGTKAFSLDDRIRCNFEELKCDLRYLLFGMNSSSFFYNCMTKTFYIRDKLHMKTLTPEIVSDMCEPFLRCAAYFHALKTFIEQRKNLPFGPVHQIYCRSLLEVLNVYRYSILNLNWTDIRCAVQLEPLITPLERRLQFLTKFCLISINEETDGFNFPSGVQLLDYLYSNLMKVFRSDFCCILIHMFEKCCNMYLKIVSEWMFEGCFSNPTNYTEFFIEIQQEGELCRDWRRVSCIRLEGKKIPKFLEKFYKDVFICGKSVNLLKIFTRRDVLDTLLPKDYPPIKCCFNKNQLNHYVVDWKKFQLANSRQYNTQKKVKDVLFETYGPEFYANVKRVREAWFENYENRSKLNNIVPEEIQSVRSEEIAIEPVIIEKSEYESCIVVTDKTSGDATAIKNDDKEQEKSKIINEKTSEFEVPENKTGTEIAKVINAVENVIKDEEKRSTEDQEEKLNLKTKKLVEFYEQLNSSATTPERSPKRSSKIVVRSPKRVIAEQKTEIRYATSECTSATDASKQEKIALNVAGSSSGLMAEIGESNSSPSFGNFKGGLETIPKIKTSTPADRPVDRVEKSSKFVDTGGGDFVWPINATTTAEHVGACGDGPNQIHSTESTFFKVPAHLNDLQRNRLKSMYSDHQNQLNVTEDLVCVEKKTGSSPLTVRQQNRVKSMSSDCLNQLVDGEELYETNRISTPLTVRDQNKLKIMSSEYHQRLTNQKMPQVDTTSLAVQQPRELSEFEKNKLKIMSSEYHLRLLDCVSHDERVTDKLTSKAVLTEGQLNKRKVMATEFYVQPKSLSVTTLLISEYPEKESSKITTPHETSLSALVTSGDDKSPCFLSAVDDTAEEPETISDDMESEDQITVMENVAQSLPSLTTEPSKVIQNGDKVTFEVPRVNNVLNLETYVSYGSAAFAHHEETDIMNCLQIAAQSVQDVDRTSLLYYLAQSISIPLRVQSKIVNDAILRVFIEEEGYLEHLATLRNYLLLRKPEFSTLLTNTMFKMAEKVKKPYLLLNGYTLSCLLQQALLAGNARESIRFERKLYFVVDDIIPQSFNLQDIKALKCISLNYSVKWPVNVLITEPVLKKYSRIFKFLMQIQRALWSLKGDFKGLKNLKRGKSMQYTMIQLYRHTMTQVVRILQEFVMREGIERCWNELVEFLSNSEITLDGLYISHLKYINKIMQRCFLCDQSITCHESVLNLLSSVLRYHAALHSGTWHRNVQVNFLYHTNFKNIQETFNQFQQHLNDIRAKLKLLVYNKQRLYFEPLLGELSR